MSFDSKTSTGLTLHNLLRDPTQPGVWERFVDRYGPRIYGWCRKWGLQKADAEDVTQDVLTKLAQRMRHFRYDPKRSFRAWLKTVTQNAWKDYLEWKARVGVEADSGFFAKLQGQTVRNDLVQHLNQEFDLELRDEAFRRIKPRVADHTWQAFHLMAVEGRPASEVAKQVGMKVAAVFVARSRVQRMVQREIKRLEKPEPD